jgi:muramoyltetrapeptide carboxypeptidase LdcA involved in peptidoglycan recycling
MRDPHSIKPRKLQPGDKVAAISLSWGGPGELPHRYQAGKRQLQDEFGVTVVETPHALRDDNWLAQNPKARADDLMEAFADSSMKAIISTIGGDDSIRLLPHIDLDVIRSNPKIFLGFSDTTITHMACRKVGLVSFYGPAIMAGFGENAGMLPYMVDSVRRTLFSSSLIGVIAPNTDGWTAEVLDWANPENQSTPRSLNPSTGWRFLQGRGVHTGRLVGGCLEVFDWLRGTEVWPDPEFWEDAILFLETAENEPSPEILMYALRSLAAVGVLQELSGILLARPGGQIPPDDFPKYDDALLQVVTKEEGLAELPLVTRMDFGHTDPMFVLPYGVRAEIDCDQRQFSIIENAVID